MMADTPDDVLDRGISDMSDQEQVNALYNGLVQESFWPFAFSPCAQPLASAFPYSKIEIWNLSTDSYYRTLKHHDGKVTAIVFSLDGQLLASGSSEGELRLWDVETGALKYVFDKLSGKIRSIAFSKDAHLLVYASEKIVRLLDVSTGASRNVSMNITGLLNMVAFSPDSQLLALVSAGDKMIQLWDATLYTNHTETDVREENIREVLFSPDGQTIASVSSDRTIQLLDAETGVRRKTPTGVKEVLFSPDNRLLASASSGRTVQIWDVENFSIKETITGNWGSGSVVAYSPDGKLVASASPSSSFPQVILWNAETGKLQHTLEVGRQKEPGTSRWTISAVVFSPDCRTVAALLWNSQLWIWDASTGNRQETLWGEFGMIPGIIFSPDSQLIAVSHRNWKTWVFNRITSSSRFIRVPEDATNVVAFSPDHRLIAIASTYREAVWVYDAKTEGP